MSQFEFLMVIAGVAIAIAMAEIVSGWGRMIRPSANVKFDWLHLGWSIAVLLNAMVYWIGVWPYAELDIQYVVQVWFLVLPTLFLVLVAFSLMPDVSQMSGQSLGEYFISNRRSFYPSYLLFLSFSTLADLIIVGNVPPIAQLLVLAVLLAGGVSLSVTQRLWAHRLGLGIYLSLMLAGGFSKLDEMSALVLVAPN